MPEKNLKKVKKKNIMEMNGKQTKEKHNQI